MMQAFGMFMMGVIGAVFGFALAWVTRTARTDVHSGASPEIERERRRIWLAAYCADGSVGAEMRLWAAATALQEFDVYFGAPMRGER